MLPIETEKTYAECALENSQVILKSYKKLGIILHKAYCII